MPERLEAWRKKMLRSTDSNGMSILLASAKRGEAETFAAVVEEITSVSTPREVISPAMTPHFATIVWLSVDHLSLPML